VKNRFDAKHGADHSGGNRYTATAMQMEQVVHREQVSNVGNIVPIFAAHSSSDIPASLLRTARSSRSACPAEAHKESTTTSRWFGYFADNSSAASARCYRFPTAPKKT
jgi:hypothetical protein